MLTRIGGVNMIENWGKVNSHLKQGMEAYEAKYFKLDAYCEDKAIVHEDYVGFIRFGRGIVTGQIDIADDLKEELAKNKEVEKNLDKISKR
jgi:hypothetical protein